MVSIDNRRLLIMKAEIICVGTEILLGDIVNTNAAYLGQQLADLGIDCFGQVVVGDNEARLMQALQNSVNNADIIIMSGGLGPTYDDLTKLSVAKFFGLDLVLDTSSWDKINELFLSRGVQVIENNRGQAMIPETAIALNNSAGVAPGILLEKEDVTVIMLPGPPREMKSIFEEEVKPYLQKRSGSILTSTSLHLYGIGEAQVAAELKDLMEQSFNPTIATYAKEGEMYIRVSAKAETYEQAKKMCEPIVSQLQTKYSEYTYGINAESFADVVIDKIIQKNKTIKIYETVTGGYIQTQLTKQGNTLSLVSGSTQDIKQISTSSLQEWVNEVQKELQEDIAVYVIGTSTEESIKINRDFQIIVIHKGDFIEYKGAVGFGYENSYNRICHVCSLKVMSILNKII